ncbi:MAG: hypothetical protein HYS27_24690 [Deltaproteobacteria bacterium]|nr:hypothetical protein [Deltaproteobacteria bacterium]
MTLPRRIQLLKLLRANGVRGVERMREDDLKDALQRLRLVVPAPSSAERPAPSSHAFLARAAEPPPPFDDGDDPHALPRFREPKLLLPEAERTFLRLIAVKPRLLFCTWDVARAERARGGHARLELCWRDFLGEPPSARDLLGQQPALVVDVDLAAGGWYLTVPGERLAIAAALVVDGARLAASNVTLTPPARPAPPGPLWLATLPPSIDRRRLRQGRLLRGEVPEAALARLGESDARGVEIDDELPASATAMRLPWLQSPAASSSSSASSVSSGRKP